MRSGPNDAPVDATEIDTPPGTFALIVERDGFGTCSVTGIVPPASTVIACGAGGGCSAVVTEESMVTLNSVAKAGGMDLILAACKYLGGWSRARELAGVRITKRRPSPTTAWDDGSVVAEIRRRHDEEIPLAVTKTRSSLTSAAQRIFGSWRAAIEAAGFEERELLRRQLSDDERHRGS